MDKTLVLEAMYETISDSLEWGLDCKDCSHSYHVDGIVAVIERILDKLETKEEENMDKLSKLANEFSDYKLKTDAAEADAFRERFISH